MENSCRGWPHRQIEEECKNSGKLAVTGEAGGAPDTAVKFIIDVFIWQYFAFVFRIVIGLACFGYWCWFWLIGIS